MMVRYAQVGQGTPFPDTPDDPKHLGTFIAGPRRKRGKGEDMDEDPLLSCLYKMTFGPAQLYVYALAWVAAFVCAPVYVDYIFHVRVLPHRLVHHSSFVQVKMKCNGIPTLLLVH
ncbi:uncharacterized protein LOC127003194 [Eriocheir sinensis]|uniref:uncharacterized protein LOC127003194 n=1 Tax=Eriocheir sinensis TaxID=95602 RepID=UPI0021CADF33|nr:uncharacterized protein LOC127003194 [Eriocheir sinensis]